MRSCDQCANWTQWRGVVKDGDGKIVLARHLCQTHKDADQTPNIKFIFVGAIPKGVPLGA